VREVTGDLWEFYNHGAHVAITTNGSITQTGLAVMGRGVALQAKQRLPQLPIRLGKALRTALRANVPKILTPDTHSMGLDVPLLYFNDWRLFSFPVKWYWRDQADPALIMRSAERLMTEIIRWSIPVVYLVRPGCGAGQLDWSHVKPLIEPIFDDDRVVIVYRPPEYHLTLKSGATIHST
jgi:hypothetical protein